MAKITNILSALLRGIFVSLVMAMILSFFLMILPQVSDPISDKEKIISNLVFAGVWLFSLIYGAHRGICYWKKTKNSDLLNE
jgi:uncharacterized membrane protein YphA (DoxX/SURF4 family)